MRFSYTKAPRPGYNFTNQLLAATKVPSQWESDSKTLMHENVILCISNTIPFLTDKSQNWLSILPTTAYRNTENTSGPFPCLVLNASLLGDFQGLLATVGGKAGCSHYSDRNGNFKNSRLIYVIAISESIIFLNMPRYCICAFQEG